MNLGRLECYLVNSLLKLHCQTQQEKNEGLFDGYWLSLRLLMTSTLKSVVMEKLMEKRVRVMRWVKAEKVRMKMRRNDVEEELGDEDEDDDEAAVTDHNDEEDAELVIGDGEDVNPFLDLA